MNCDNFICENCSSEVDEFAKFCSDCGSLFEKNIICINHPDENAKGVCVICFQPFCRKCGLPINRGFANDIYLCEKHSNYEIIEGMVRAYGTYDDVQAQYICDCLEKEGLHPFLFIRKASPIHLGGTNYTLYRASGDFNGHIINEDKVMVPLGELIRAENIIKEIEKDL